MNRDTVKGSFEWLLCPVCGSKTRIKLRSDTQLINFPLFCPKCRKETLIHVKEFKNLYSQAQSGVWTASDAVMLRHLPSIHHFSV